MSVRRRGNLRRDGTKRVNKMVDKTMRAVALNTFNGIRRKTPVDTGTARANWNASIGKPDKATFTIPDALPDDSAIATYDRQQEVQNRQTVRKWNARTGESAWITNALPYIMRLEYGYSDQTPEGMVRTTLAETRAQLRRIARNA